MASANEVLEFWFSDRARPLWFEKDASFDADIRSRFDSVIAEAATGVLDRWLSSSDGALALTVVLDQFPRNIHRGSPRAFEYDARARAVADTAIRGGLDLAQSLERRMFCYLPFEHSELLADQERSVELFSRWAEDHGDGPLRVDADDQMTYVRRHHEIIRRFGRFPHRNAVLGRSSTPAELAFLDEPSSSF
jgi:uncharacterized protein (DUF924 family)